MSRLPIIAVAAACLWISGTPGRGSPPRERLPEPMYSFDVVSPQTEPTMPLRADDILGVVHNTQGSRPEVRFRGGDLGMGQDGDELDALTVPIIAFPGNATFTLLISVDRATVGQATPEPQLIFQDVPYNVRNQAARGQAASDLFMSTRLFTRDGMVPGPERLLGGNTALVINNFNEGGTDMAAEPPTSAHESSSGPQDNVDATAYIDTNGVRGVAINVVFYSAGRQSPSLGAPGQLPGNSGADIFGHVLKPGTTAFVYAHAEDLGLQPMDDIDSLLVFEDGDLIFDAGDQILFSLTPDSPSLQAVGASGADIFSVVRIGPTPQITPFARAIDLGLISGPGSPDNVDALEIVLCQDPVDCIRRNGIRRVGDQNRDQDVDLRDVSVFWSCFSGPVQSPDFVPPSASCQAIFDSNEDTDIDLDDWRLVAHDMTGPI